MVNKSLHLRTYSRERRAKVGRPASAPPEGRRGAGGITGAWSVPAEGVSGVSVGGEVVGELHVVH
jgi:hypothetical protein